MTTLGQKTTVIIAADDNKIVSNKNAIFYLYRNNLTILLSLTMETLYNNTNSKA